LRHLLEFETRELDQVVRQAGGEAPHAQAAVQGLAEQPEVPLRLVVLPLQAPQ